MPTFTLAISCLTTSNLPWFMELTFQVPMKYYSLASDLASITSHIHNWVLFLFWLHPFILTGVISPLISRSVLGTYWLGELLFQYPIILPFHTVHGVLNTKANERIKCSYKYLDKNVCSSFIQNSSNLERTRISINKMIDKPGVVYLYNRMFQTN